MLTLVLLKNRPIAPKGNAYMQTLFTSYYDKRLKSLNRNQKKKNFTLRIFTLRSVKIRSVRVKQRNLCKSPELDIKDSIGTVIDVKLRSLTSNKTT